MNLICFFILMDSFWVWDLRNMRSAIASVRLDSAANRLAISSKNLVAIPHDNRNIRICDLNNFRLTRIPRANGRASFFLCILYSFDSIMFSICLIKFSCNSAIISDTKRVEELFEID